MNRLSVGFDIDDVLLPSSDHVTRLHNEIYGTSLTRDNWYVNLPAETWGATTEHEVIDHVNEILASESYLTGIEPIEGARRVLEDLDAAGDTYFAVTSRPQTLAVMTHRALEVCYPGMFPEGNVSFINHSTASDSVNTLTKVEIARANGATHFIDDFEHHLIPMAAAGIKPLLYGDAYLWNRAADTPGLVRVANMEAVQAELRHDRRAY